MTALSGNPPVLKERMARYCLSPAASPRRKTVEVESSVPPWFVVSPDSGYAHRTRRGRTEGGRDASAKRHTPHRMEKPSCHFDFHPPRWHCCPPSTLPLSAYHSRWQPTCRKIIRPGVGGFDVCLLAPGCPAAGENIRRAGIYCRVVKLIPIYARGVAIFPGRANQQCIPGDGNRIASLITRPCIGGFYICLLSPGYPIVGEDIGCTGLAAELLPWFPFTPLALLSS